MMNKIAKKGAIGVACACALALACGTAAFAEGASVGNPGNFTNGNANSTLSVKTDATQLAATVPLSVTVVADALGGAFTGVPSEDAYKITNKSYFDIVVSDIAATEKSTWHYSDTTLSSASKTPTGDPGDINLTLTPSGKTATIVKHSGTNPAAADWKIPAATDLANGELPMAVGGSTSVLKKSLGDASSEAVTVTFTIAPATA